MTLTAPAHDRWLRAMHRGQKRYQQKRFSDAILAYKKAVKIAPKQAESWSNLGGVQLESGQYQAALTSLNKALNLNPKLMQAHLNKGDTLRRLNQIKAAVIAYNSAVNLQRNPDSLNKLACALRQINKPEEAEKLYLEALEFQLSFTLARVNLATVQIQLDQFEEADIQLKQLQHLQLPIAEAEEVKSVQLSLNEYQRFNPSITSLLQKNDPSTLLEAIQATTETMLQADPKISTALSHYVASANNLAGREVLCEHISDHPEWAMIEAMHMIPLADNPKTYLHETHRLKTTKNLSTEQRESFNMISVVNVARQSQADLNDPILAELHLRHWHALACRNLSGFLPGHFKISRNFTLNDMNIHRAEPHLVTGSIRDFIQYIYSQYEPGLTRALICWMAICDIHPFADGNGRVAMCWMNRELEWAGLTPCLLTRELGIKGEFSQAMQQVRKTGNITLLLPALIKAQQKAIDFCTELKRLRV